MNWQHTHYKRKYLMNSNQYDVVLQNVHQIVQNCIKQYCCCGIKIQAMLAALHRLLRGQDELSFLRQLTTPLDLNFLPLSKQRQEAKDKRQTIKDDRCANVKLTRCFVTLKPLFGCICYLTLLVRMFICQYVA